MGVVSVPRFSVQRGVGGCTLEMGVGNGMMGTYVGQLIRGLVWCLLIWEGGLCSFAALSPTGVCLSVCIQCTQ